MSQPGDLVEVVFPFAGGGAKRRPGMVVLDTGDRDIVFARVTTQLYSAPHDVALADWKAAGLRRPSVVRLHKLATIERRFVGRQFAFLSPADRRQVGLVLDRMWSSVLVQFRV